MSKDEKTTITAMSVVLTLGILITALTLGWPIWAWLPLGLVPGVGAVLLTNKLRSRRDQLRMQQEFDGMAAAPEPEPEQPRQEPIAEVSLPSAVLDYRFLLSGTAYWLPNPNASGGEHWNLGAVAKDAIVSRAAEVLAAAQPDEHSTLDERLNAVLGTALTVSSGQVLAWGRDLVVTLPDLDKQRLDRLAEVRKEVEVWEHERNHERNIREYLGEDALSSPGSAVVWWLARHHEDSDSGLRAAVENICNLRKLTSAAHETEIPEWSTFEAASSPGTDPVPAYTFHPFGDDGSMRSTFVVNGEVSPNSEQFRVQRLVTLIVEAIADKDEDERSLFVQRQAQLLDLHGYHEEAAALRARFDMDSPSQDETASAPATEEEDWPHTLVLDEDS